MTIELNANPLTGTFFEANTSKYLLRDNNDLSIFDFHSHVRLKEISFNGDLVLQLFIDECFLYVSKEIDAFKTSKTNRVNLENYEIEEFDLMPFSNLIECGHSESVLHAKSREHIYKVIFNKIEGPLFKKITKEPLKRFRTSYSDMQFSGYDGKKKETFAIDLEGKILWSKSLNEYKLLNESTFASKFFSFNEKSYSVTYDSELICFSSIDGAKLWSFLGCSSVAVEYYRERLYTFYGGKLLVIDAETGRLINAEKIDLGLDEAEQNELALFQLLITDTHAWCAFLGGRGLQAINLETFKVDWSGFEGRTLNVPPQLRNNYMFLNFMDGGIGIGESSGCSNFMLEGVGGYNIAAGKDKFFLS